MRLYSIHPKYLDRKGLSGLWAEGHLAQSVLLKGEYSICPECNGNSTYPLRCKKCNCFGKIKTPYYNHPQLERFKKETLNKTMASIGQYLYYIWEEAKKRGYNFDIEKVEMFDMNLKMTVTRGQLSYEFHHLQKKLKDRDFQKLNINNNLVSFNDVIIEPHPLFKVIEGDIESWEKVKE